jgi:hypothetical protein
MKMGEMFNFMKNNGAARPAAHAIGDPIALADGSRSPTSRLQSGCVWSLTALYEMQIETGFGKVRALQL